MERVESPGYYQRLASAPRPSHDGRGARGSLREWSFESALFGSVYGHAAPHELAEPPAPNTVSHSDRSSAPMWPLAS